MGEFFGHIGSSPLPRPAGPGTWRSQSGPGWSIVTRSTTGESVGISVCPDGTGATVSLGDPARAGCAVTLTVSLNHPLTASFYRDPFGQSAVYTAPAKDNSLLFASDPRLLRPYVGGQVDANALQGYLCFSHVPAPRTLWKGITQASLELAHHNAPVNAAEEPTASCERLRALLRAAVGQRITTPDIGVYLSGGLDSSLVAALLVEAGLRPRLFTLDFGAPHDAELPLAQAVSSHLDLPLTVVPARPRHILRGLEETARALPQPFGDGVTVPLWLLGQAAHNQVSEVWNGEGGDQLFGGWANKPMIAALAYGEDSSSETEVAEYLATYHRFWGLTDRLYAPALQQIADKEEVTQGVRLALDRNTHPTLLHRLRAANLRLKGAQNIAPRMVALAACHGLRVRAPFFDSDLAAWTFTLPPDALLSGASEKHLLKQVAEAYLPADIVWREKRGMGVPTADWCLHWGQLRWEVKRRLSPGRMRRQGWFESSLIRSLLRGEDPTAEGAFRRRRVGEKLWLLLMLQVWCDIHGVSEVELS